MPAKAARSSGLTAASILVLMAAKGFATCERVRFPLAVKLMTHARPSSADRVLLKRPKPSKRPAIATTAEGVRDKFLCLCVVFRNDREHSGLRRCNACN